MANWWWKGKIDLWLPCNSRPGVFSSWPQVGQVLPAATVPGPLHPFVLVASPAWLLEFVISELVRVSFPGTTFLCSGPRWQEPSPSSPVTGRVHTPNSHTEGCRVLNSVKRWEIQGHPNIPVINFMLCQKTTKKASSYRVSKSTLLTLCCLRGWSIHL